MSSTKARKTDDQAPAPTLTLADAVETVADRLEQHRVPALVERWRVQAATAAVPAWRMRRDVLDAFRDEWRRAVRQPRRGETRVIVAAFRQIGATIDAELLAADPATFPALTGRAVRRHVERRR